ncbi:MAG: hypothetical protein ABJJ53_16390 [Sulfitobacter sp.]
MNKITYDGKVDEQDLWKLFTHDPDKPSETILFYCQLKPLLKPMKFQDEGRKYHLFEHSTVPATSSDARLRATVTQKNLRSVADAMSKQCQDVAIQYVGCSCRSR